MLLREVVERLLVLLGVVVERERASSSRGELELQGVVSSSAQSAPVVIRVVAGVLRFELASGGSEHLLAAPVLLLAVRVTHCPGDGQVAAEPSSSVLLQGPSPGPWNQRR